MRVSTQIYFIDGSQWLMMFRNKKQNDINHGKWIACGGKIEKGETVLQCAAREAFEETGLICDQLDLRGIVWFEYDQTQPEKIYIYTCEQFHGSLTESREGTLAWIQEDRLMELEMWEGDRIFMKDLIQRKSEHFGYVLHYDSQDRLTSVKEREAEE